MITFIPYTRDKIDELRNKLSLFNFKELEFYTTNEKDKKIEYSKILGYQVLNENQLYLRLRHNLQFGQQYLDELYFEKNCASFIFEDDSFSVIDTIENKVLTFTIKK